MDAGWQRRVYVSSSVIIDVPVTSVVTDFTGGDVDSGDAVHVWWQGVYGKSL